MLCTIAFNAPVWVVEYCDERVCLCVSVSLPESISPGKHARFSQFLCTLPTAVDRSSGGVAIRYVLLVFMDDVIFGSAYTGNGPHGGMLIPLQRVTSLRRRAQANAPAALY